MRLLKRGAAILMSLVMIAGSLFMQPLTAYADSDNEPNYYINYDRYWISNGTKKQGFYYIGPDGPELDGTWECSDPDIIQIDVYAGVPHTVVTALNVGTTTVKYTSHDGVHSGTCAVTVVPGLNYNYYTLTEEGTGVQLEYNGLNGNQMVMGKWRSSDPGVVTVDSFGYVKPVSAGEADISYYGTDELMDLDACHIVVRCDGTPKNRLNYREKTIRIGEKFVGLHYFNTDGEWDTNGDWIIKDSNIANFNSDNEIIGVNVGTTEFTYNPHNSGYYGDTCVVNVYQGLNYHTMYLWVGNTNASKQLVFTDANGEPVSGTFYNNGPELISIDGEGNVTPTGCGACMVHFVSDNEVYEDTCAVIIQLDYEMSYNYYEAVEGNSIDMYYYGTTGSQLNTDEFDWTSSDENVVIFDPVYNRVRAVGSGEADITFTTKDGEHTDTCHFVIHPGIGKEARDMELFVGEEVQLNFKLLNGETVPFTFCEVDDSSVITLNEDGVLKAVGTGYSDYQVEVEISDDIYLIDRGSITVAPARINQLSSHEMMLKSQGWDYLYFIDENGNQTTEGKWESSDESIAQYSTGGWVQAKKPGIAIITYTSPDGLITDSCIVYVFQGLNEHEHVFYNNGNMEPFQLYYTNADG